jgi:ABC-type multidrug transport system permease subunit
MKTDATKQSWREVLRLVWVIAAKDIAGAIRNKMTLTIASATIFTVMLSQALPFLLNVSGKSLVVVYDTGDSSLTAALEASDQFQVRSVDSQEALEERLVDLNAKALGIVVPADLDDTLAAGEVGRVDGYVTWAKRGKARALKADFEQQAGELLGQPVRVDYGDGVSNIVYPAPDSPGVLGMFAGTVVMVVFLVGCFVVPYLVIEEKQAKTLDALLTSPAGVGQVVAGKALVGLFYCLIASGVAIAFQWAAVVHWGLVVTMIVLGSLCVVAVGLLLGNLFDDPQKMGFWVAIPMMVLFSAMFLTDLNLAIPPFLSILIDWLPTTAMTRVVRLSFSQGATVVQALPEFGVVLAVAVVLYGVVVWQVRRMDR